MKSHFIDGRIDVDQLAKELGLPTWENWSEHFDYSDGYMHAYNSAKQIAVNRGATDEDADAAGEEAGQQAEQEQQEEEYRNYYDNLMHVAEEVFRHHGLQLVPADDPGHGPGWKMSDDLDGVRKKKR